MNLHGVKITDSAVFKVPIRIRRDYQPGGIKWNRCIL